MRSCKKNGTSIEWGEQKDEDIMKTSAAVKRLLLSCNLCVRFRAAARTTTNFVLGIPACMHGRVDDVNDVDFA